MGLRAALIGGNSKSSQWTVEAMRNYFDEVDHLYIKHIDINFSGDKAEVLYKGKQITHYDCLMVKGSFRYAELLRSICDIYSKDETVFIPTKSSAFTIAHDKLLTQLTLQKKNIPMPRTYLSATVDAAREVLSKMNYPIIMKFPKGTQGKGVMFADSFASASSILDALDALNQPFIIQEYVETDSSDIRILVVGGEIVAGMRRKSSGVDKRANLHAGGSGEPFIPDPKMKTIALKAAEALGTDICGVDILEGPKGPLVIEINISPGLQGITATGIDVADKIAQYLYKKTQETVGMRKEQMAKEILSEINTPKSSSEEAASPSSSEQEMITQLDFRGGRILLPEVVAKISGFDDSDSVNLKVAKGKITLERFM